MIPFTHEHAEVAHIDFTPVSGGGLVATTLTVIANIPLATASKGYSPAKANSLTKAAADYARKAGIAEVIFKSTS